MAKRSKRLRDFEKDLDEAKVYSVQEALEMVLKAPKAKFDESVELSLKLGVDPKKADQQVRGTISLPHGTGKEAVVVVFAKGDKAQEAKEAGADFVGAEDLEEKIKGGWFDFTHIVATPDMMRIIGKLGKLLGPRGLMPSPKAGTVTTDIAKAVSEIKAGKIEFKVDKSAGIHVVLGKKSFTKEQLKENLDALMGAINRAKPPASKGAYIRAAHMSSTMGTGFKIENYSLQTG